MNETKTRPNTDYIDNNRAQTLLEKWSPVLDYTLTKFLQLITLIRV